MIETKRQELQNYGFTQIKLDLPLEILNLVKNECWDQLDKSLYELTSKDGLIHQTISLFTPIDHIEFIIAIREAPGDDDGIWHDDGSRVLAYTLSLTENTQQLEGGILQFRRKGNSEIKLIPTPEFGVLTIFKTGVDGYEHCLLKVEKGRRIISAGWIYA